MTSPSLSYCKILVGLLASGPAFGAVGDNDVGMNVHDGNPAFVDAAAALGVTWIRVDANWFVLEPADDAYDWTQLDAAVDDAASNGLSVFMTLAYTPSWVPRHGDTDGMFHNDVPDASTEWSDFVSDAVTHFRMRGVRHFGMWNEANLDGFFQGTVDEYATIIANPGAIAVRAACVDCFVLGPELANVGDADDYLEAVLQRTPGAWDIITHHNYGAFVETGWQIFDGDSFINALDDQRFPFTRRDLRQILDGAGWMGEVWITESGYRAAPPGDAGEEMLQAIYVRRVLEEQLSRAWYTNTFFYEMGDCGVDQPTCTIDGFGLIRPTGGTPGQRSFPQDFRTKPAFLELMQFIQNNPSIVGGSAPPQCGDGDDNDGDMRIDERDRGCADPLDDDESNDPPRERFAAKRASIIVDGDLSDFDADGWIALTEWRGTEPLSGAGDVEVRAAARWDATALYLAFEVTDDVHQNDRPPAELWQSDSVQIAFDVAQSGGDAYDAIDDHEINFAISAGAPSSFRFHGPAGASDAWSFAAARTGSITRYEIGLSPAVIPQLVLADGSLAGFSFLVNEDDGAGRVGWMEWSRGIGQAKEPEWFGEIALIDGPVVGQDAGTADAAEDASEEMDASEVADGGAIDGGSDSGSLDAATPKDGGVLEDASIGPTPDDEGCGCTASMRSRSSIVWLGAALLVLSQRFRRA